ncbi:uncharacterized protein LOC142355166 [Convolutriloba macropyga]|uniref:uncharacterized protein LOC142355166 n=1 Tax=Convolutriloba macropyga TaxID=536237 RepID=UPI003F51E7C1
MSRFFPLKRSRQGGPLAVEATMENLASAQTPVPRFPTASPHIRCMDLCVYTYSRSGTPAAKPGLCLSSKNSVALSHTPERACNAAAGVTSRTFETTGRSRQKLQQKITAGTGQDRESDTSRLPISQSHRSRAGPGSGGHRFDLEHELHVTDRKLLHMIAAPLDDTRVASAVRHNHKPAWQPFVTETLAFKAALDQSCPQSSSIVRSVQLDRMQVITGVAGFKQIVRLAARYFYCGQVPPPETTGKGGTTRKKVNVTGLAVVTLDALTRREWIEEERLAEELKLHPQLLRRTLKELEVQQFVQREHRKFKDHQKALQAEGSGEGRKPLHSKTQTICCINYPRALEVVQLRIYLMRKKLNDELEEADPVMKYKCPKCSKTYSAMDALRLIDFMTSRFRCEDCSTELEQALGSSGETGDDEQRRARKQALQKLKSRMEAQLKPLMDQLKAVKDLDPPDYGSHQDWSREQSFIRLQKSGKAANPIGSGSKGAAGGVQSLEPYWSDKTQVEVEVGSEVLTDTTAPSSFSTKEKEMPAWMISEADRVKASTEDSRIKQAQVEQHDSTADPDRRLHEEFVRQYMQEVQQRKALSAMRRHDAPEAKTEFPPLKRAKSEHPTFSTGGVKEERDSSVEATHAQDDTVTWEEAHTDGRALVKHDSIEWEDADGNLGGTGEGTPTQDPMQGGTTRQVANPMGDSLPGKVEDADEDDLEWEDPQ